MHHLEWTRRDELHIGADLLLDFHIPLGCFCDSLVADFGRVVTGGACIGDKVSLVGVKRFRCDDMRVTVNDHLLSSSFILNKESVIPDERSSNLAMAPAVDLDRYRCAIIRRRLGHALFDTA